MAPKPDAFRRNGAEHEFSLLCSRAEGMRQALAVVSGAATKQAAEQALQAVVAELQERITETVAAACSGGVQTRGRESTGAD